MLNPDLFDRVRSVVCIGAHSDDVEIGCGGTIRRLAQQHPDITFTIVVMTGGEERIAEAMSAAERFCGEAATVVGLGFRDGYLPYDAAAAKDALREATSGTDPDLVFSHRRDDLHQDHRFVADVTGQLFRDHLTLGYEIPKYDGDLGTCNLYVPIADTAAAAKASDIVAVFDSQRVKPWMSEETFLGLMRLRGIEAKAASGYAEGFVVTKVVVGT